MAGGIFGFRPDNTLGALFLTPPKGNEAHWRRKLANQGGISKARPSLAGRLENATVSALRKAGVSDKRAARLGSKTFAAVNDFTPLGNATMAADAGDAFRGGNPFQGLGLSALAVLPGAAGKVGKGMFGGGIRAYHGTTSEFDQFGRIDGGNANGRGYYFTTDPEEASRYATGEGVNRISPSGNAGPNVRPVELMVSRPFDGAAPADRATMDELAQAAGWKPGEIYEHFDRPTKLRDVLQYLTYNADEQNDILRAAGFDGRLGGYGENDVMVFEPSQIRPWFGR